MDTTFKRSGGCLCGAANVTATLNSNELAICHCAMCRKWGGGPLFAVEGDSAVNFDGEDAITIFNSSEWAERGFCKHCGTHLFYRLKQGGHYAIPVGLFDESNDWTLTHQIFIDHKPGFYSLAEKTKNLTGEEVFQMFGGE